MQGKIVVKSEFGYQLWMSLIIAFKEVVSAGHAQNMHAIRNYKRLEIWKGAGM